MKRTAIVLFMFYMSMESVFAQGVPEAMKSAMKNPASDMPSLLNLIISMTVVIGLIYLTGWIYQKLNRLNRSKLNDYELLERNNFKVLSSLPLGQHKHLYAVEINGKVLVLGSTQDNISLLKEFDSEEEYNAQYNKKNVSEEKIKEEKAQCLELIYQKYKGV